jgi:hypothetical protein
MASSSDDKGKRPWEDDHQDPKWKKEQEGPTLHVLDLNSMPVIKEGMLVTDEFCAQYRVLEKEVEILQEENLRLRRMLEYFINPRLIPLPPKE